MVDHVGAAVAALPVSLVLLSGAAPADAAAQTTAPHADVVTVAAADAVSAADQAVDWAKQRLGTDSYHNMCADFARDAWLLSSGIDIGAGYTSANDWAESHRGQLQTEGTPPAGSTVWWYGEGDYPDGHAAISLGDGTAVSTAERTYTDVHVMSIVERNETKPYAGWYLPA
ncbi:CHAP domain-containing protein [Actinoplanes sp. NPDC051494]|uniref:CHAP domain-containing protein n=1 Tax=Actinoplanes sp. NPDC051494 TaxID=3363907 RepID=UPI0037BA9080